MWCIYMWWRSWPSLPDWSWIHVIDFEKTGLSTCRQAGRTSFERLCKLKNTLVHCQRCLKYSITCLQVLSVRGGGKGQRYIFIFIYFIYLFCMYWFSFISSFLLILVFFCCLFSSVSVSFFAFWSKMVEEV